MQSFARKALRDVAPLVSDRPGVLHWVKDTARVVRARFKVALDKDFATLFPVEGRRISRLATREKQHAAVKHLAREWSEQPASEVVSRIMQFESEAKLADLHCARWTPVACREIALRTNDPLTWIQSLLDADASSELVGPFLWKAHDAGAPELRDILASCVQRPNQRIAALDVVFTMSTPPDDLLGFANDQLEEETKWVTLRIYANEIAEHHALAMLRHPARCVRAAAACGEWESEPKGQIRNSLQDAWRAAVVESVEDEYWLPDAFRSNTGLAFDWLDRRVHEKSRILRSVLDASRVLEAARESLTNQQREAILAALSDDYCYIDLLETIIGDDLKLFAKFLRSDQLRRVHLSLLAGHPGSTWADKPIKGSWVERAILTLDAGYTVDDVAEATIGSSWSWSGNESDMWAAWIERFEPFRSHPDFRVRGVVGRILEHAGAQRERAIKKEYDEAVHGRIS